MADAKESLWTGKFHAPSATARAPYGDPLADPFKPKPDAGRAGQVERLPQILGPLHAEQERVRTIFEKGSGKPPRTSTALRIFHRRRARRAIGPQHGQPVRALSERG